MPEFKQTLHGGQVVDADWWVTTKVVALCVAAVAFGIGIGIIFI
ncbi:MAG: hypothetical protein OXK76_07600 [Gammaproteobacteria bacterium]|nr:hypothetical protein [Gammaproteobacteria bacterium]